MTKFYFTFLRVQTKNFDAILAVFVLDLAC